MSFDHTTLLFFLEQWTLVLFPIRPTSYGAQLSNSYAPLEGECVGILSGCCGMSFDYTSPSFSLVPWTYVLFSLFGPLVEGCS
jgi:hypothetical protein